METLKNDSDKRPLIMAKRNCYALGTVNIVLGIALLSSKMQPAVLLIILGAILVFAGYFISKEKSTGIYLTWIYILIGIIVSIYNSAFLAILILAYLGYWNFKAQKHLK